MKTIIQTQRKLVFTVLLFILAVGSADHATATVSSGTDTYVFTSSTSDTRFNGSTITIDGTGSTGVASFDFFDSGVQFTTGTIDTYETHITSYGASGWYGSVGVDNLGGGDQAAYATGDGTPGT